MAKRYTDSKIWKSQVWFKRLSPVHKLAWKYVTDVCDHSGIWNVDVTELCEDLGLDSFDIKAFAAACNRDYDKFTGKELKRERVIIHHNKLWLTGFIQFQYENKEGIVARTNPVASKAFDLLKANGLLSKALKDKFLKTD